MDIVTTQAATSGTALATKQTETSSALASDFETFLKMLTAQARYQDPLEPIDSSEYAAQLAQFSMVEQQVLSNDLLTGLAAQLNASAVGQAAGWIGMDARSASAAAFSGTPVTILPTVEPGAEEATLIVTRPDGSELHRRQIATTGELVQWDGTLDDGSIAPDDVYTFRVESRAQGEIIGTSQAETYTRIVEARTQGDTTVFVLDSGDTVTAGQITALRAPDAGVPTSGL